MLIPKDAKGKKQSRVLRQLSLVAFDSRREWWSCCCLQPTETESYLRYVGTAKICPRTGAARLGASERRA